MPNYSDFCINKSGNSYPIYNVSNQRVGTLYNREASVYLGDEGSRSEIAFLNSSGNIQTVEIDTYDHPIPAKTFTLCTDYPYSRETINGVNYYIFKMRETKNVYNANGNYWGRVAAGMFVATTNAKVHSNNLYWKEINYVKSTAGNWVQVGNHGYVDTGFNRYSGYERMAFYGSW